MAWYIIRYSPDKFDQSQDNTMYAQVGDIIKFGRVRFRIRRLVLGNEEETSKNVDFYELGGEDFTFHPKEEEESDMKINDQEGELNTINLPEPNFQRNVGRSQH